MSRFILFVFFFIYYMPAHAGVVMAGTRFVYDEGKSSLSISLKNTSSTPFLVQVKVLKSDDYDNIGPLSTDFVVTPPIFLMSGGRENKVRVIQATKIDLSNKEGLFWVSVSAIPESTVSDNAVQVAIRSNYKMFYRPSNLLGRQSDAYKKIVWKRSNSTGVVIKNPTPYYVTLFDVKVNGVNENGIDMIPPFSQRSISWCSGSENCKIAWGSLNDFGGVLPMLSIAVGREWNAGV